MSNITKEIINIKLDEHEKEKLVQHLTKITTWEETLNEVDTSNVEILNNVHNINLTLFPDEIEKTNETVDILKNTMDARYDYFAVPKVIDQN